MNKIKKKSHKRKKSIDENEQYEPIKLETVQSPILYTILPSDPKKNFELDANESSICHLVSQKGHSTYYSKQNISSGTFYYEVTIKSLDYNIIEYINAKRNDEFSKKYYESILSNVKLFCPTVRIGFANLIGDLDVPVGSEDYSYGYRSIDGALINRGDYTFGNCELRNGDCMGVLIHLKPPKPEFLKVDENVQTELNEECYIKFFLNGKLQKEQFNGIYEGSYSAAVTLYNFAEMTINFGPNFGYSYDDLKHVKCFSEIDK